MTAGCVDCECAACTNQGSDALLSISVTSRAIKKSDSLSEHTSSLKGPLRRCSDNQGPGVWRSAGNDRWNNREHFLVGVKSDSFESLTCSCTNISNELRKLRLI